MAPCCHDCKQTEITGCEDLAELLALARYRMLALIRRLRCEQLPVRGFHCHPPLW